MDTLFYTKIISFLGEYAPKVFASFVLLWAGFWIIKRIVRIFETIAKKQNLDDGLRTFGKSLLSAGLRILLIIIVLGQLGVATSSLVALLGAAGLALGLALQGSLSNFAGGALILFFKPFKVGDLIEAQGHRGVVQSIRIFVTTLLTADNKVVILPNGDLSNKDIINYSSQEKRRIDLVIGIAYEASIQEARKVIMKVLAEHPCVLKDPEPLVCVLELGDSSVNLGVRPWVKTEEYWNSYITLLEKIKEALDEKGIEIPFPQRVVHHINHSHE